MEIPTVGGSESFRDVHPHLWRVTHSHSMGTAPPRPCAVLTVHLYSLLYNKLGNVSNCFAEFCERF